MEVASENHRKFLQHLDVSGNAVWSVARLLNKLGYNVTVPTVSKAEKHSDWKSHADSGDLYIDQRIEVKRLSAEFTSEVDWPYKDKFIVCARHAFDRAKPKPFAFVILSASGRHAASVFGADSKLWYVEKRTDSRYEGVEQEFYFSPMDRVRFFSMPGE